MYFVNNETQNLSNQLAHFLCIDILDVTASYGRLFDIIALFGSISIHNLTSILI